MDSDMSPEEMAELQKKNCIFCKIMGGDVPSKKIYEDEHMLAILDIHPATEGHVLVMPKEHYPILPLVPDEVRKHLFKTTKKLAEAVKQGTPALESTIFIANGGVAGQQSPHFIYHIIPTDGDVSFELPKKDISQKDLLQPLQNNLGIMMKKYLAKEGMMPGQEKVESANENLAILLDQNPQIKQALIEDPEQIKKLCEKNPKVAQVFQGVDIDKLSAKLREQMEPMPEEPTDKKATSDQAGEADLDKISRMFK